MSEIPYSVRSSRQSLKNLVDTDLLDVSAGDLIKYDGDKFVKTLTKEIVTPLTQNTALKVYIDQIVKTTTGAILEAEPFDVVKRRLNLSTDGIGAAKSGITVTSEGRVGFNVIDPQEDFELDGNIQLDTGGVQRGRVIFYDKQNDHEHAEVDGLGDGTNGGVLAFYTKVDGGSVTEKLKINNVGAFALSGSYGSSGQILTSNGSGSAVSWTNTIGSFHMSIIKNGLQNFTINTGSSPIWYGGNKITNWSVISQSSSQWSSVNHWWVCPSSGNYLIMGNIIISGGNNNIVSGDIRLVTNNSSEARISWIEFSRSPSTDDDDIQYMNMPFHRIVTLNSGNTLHFKAVVQSTTYNSVFSIRDEGSSLTILKLT